MCDAETASTVLRWDAEADDAEAARRVVWIQYHLRLGNYDEATELGWDGDQ
jgi:hypothetical protein